MGSIHMKRDTICILIDNDNIMLLYAFLLIALQICTEHSVKCGLLEHTSMSPLTTFRLQRCMTAEALPG